MSGTAGNRRVETNETARATATAAIKTSVAVKSPAFGPLKIGGGRKGATAGSKSFGRAFANKNKMNGPISTPNFSQGDCNFPRVAFGTGAPACISFIQFDLSGFLPRVTNLSLPGRRWRGQNRAPRKLRGRSRLRRPR